MSTAPSAHKLNQALIDKLVTDGQLTAPAVEAAFRNVLRHHFVPDQPMEDVYQDRAIGTKVMDEDTVSSSSQPTMMAIMLEQLALEPGHSVLEIGAGTGYNAALMAHLVGETGHVVTVDIDQDIVEDAKDHLAAAGVSGVEAVCADGGYGWLPGAPYDRIILTVGADDIAPAWWDQLKQGGLLILPLELGLGQFVIAFDKVEEERDGEMQEKLVSQSIAHCRFIRLRGAFASTLKHYSLDSKGECSLIVTPKTAEKIDVQGLDALLHASPILETTGVEATAKEVWESLGSWLLLKEQDTSLLIATGSAAVQQLFPSLTAFRSSQFNTSVCLCSDRGMAILYHPAEDASMQTGTKTYPLMVALYGNAAALYDRLCSLVGEWTRLGRPRTTEMQVTAIRRRREAEVITRARPDEIVLSKEWNNYCIRMPKT